MWVSRSPGSGSLTLAVGQKASSQLYVQCAPLTLAQGAAGIHMVLPYGAFPARGIHFSCKLPWDSSALCWFQGRRGQGHPASSGLVTTGFLLLSCFLTILTSVIFTPAAAQQTWTPFLARCEVTKQRANLDQSKAQLSCGVAGPVCAFCRSSWSSQDSWPPEGSQTQPPSQSVFLTVWKLLALAGLFEKSIEVVHVHGRTTVASYLSQKVVQTFTILGNIVKQPQIKPWHGVVCLQLWHLKLWPCLLIPVHELKRPGN